MIPVSTLYDEYIDRPKLTEQKNPFEYIVPSPLKRGRNNQKSIDSKLECFFYSPISSHHNTIAMLTNVHLNDNHYQEKVMLDKSSDRKIKSLERLNRIDRDVWHTTSDAKHMYKRFLRSNEVLQNNDIKFVILYWN